MKVLIIEENMALAESLQTLLTEKGYGVDAVHDGEYGVAYGRTDIYDVIILNANISQWGGYQITRYLRMYMINTPIIMLSDKNELSDRIEGLDAGADYYLAKPFANQELLSIYAAEVTPSGSWGGSTG